MSMGLSQCWEQSPTLELKKYNQPKIHCSFWSHQFALSIEHL